MSTVHKAYDLTDTLSEEHALILHGAELFQRFAELVRSGAPYDPGLGRKFLRFLREFADADHHHKEEAILFPWLEAHGLPHEFGPLALLRAEHELGRELRLALSFVLDALCEDPREDESRQRFHALAQRYTLMLRAHVEKEETVLLPLARRFAAQVGETPVVPGGVRPEPRRWLAAIEALAHDWPALVPVTNENGTPYAFERLCEEVLS